MPAIARRRPPHRRPGTRAELVHRRSARSGLRLARTWSCLGILSQPTSWRGSPACTSRRLAGGAADSLPQIPITWLTPEGRLDKGRLLRSFMDFWAQHGEPLLRTAPYHEVAPHLVRMAFLHRVVNGSSIEREYAIARGRMDCASATRARRWRSRSRSGEPAGRIRRRRARAARRLPRGARARSRVARDLRPPPGAAPGGGAAHGERGDEPAGNRVTMIRA